jgi:hypothetical protein
VAKSVSFLSICITSYFRVIRQVAVAAINLDPVLSPATRSTSKLSPTAARSLAQF